MIRKSSHPAVELLDGTLHELILQGLARRGDDVAIIDTGADRSISGSSMADWIGHEVRRFHESGLKPGDTLGLVGPGGAAWLASALGAIGAGLTVVPLNPMVPAHLAASLLATADATTVVTAAATAEWAGEVTGGNDKTIDMADLDDLLAEAPPDPVPTSVDIDTDAFLLASSGTTGLPKLVRVTHRVMGATVQLVPPAVGFGPDDTMLVALPLFHSGGLTVACIPLAVGARLVIQPAFNPAGFVASIEAHRVTATVVVPPICHALVSHPAVDDHDLSSLRFVQSTAAPLAPAVQERLAERLDCMVGQGLGLTEALPVSLTSPHHPVALGSSGRAVPNTELRLVDPETDDDVIQPGGIGELWVRGPQVMAGYLDAPEASAEALTADRWLRTGDLCRIDQDGNIFVVDRLKELIKVSGYQVAPAMIEAALLQHPAVVDCAVVGRPDERRGEVPIAWVVSRNPIEARELIELAARNTPPYARLHDVKEIDAIPRNPTGKILRRALREQDRTPAATG